MIRAFIVATVLLAGPAQAQHLDDRQAVALADEAVQAFDMGDFPQAVQLFMEAFEKNGDPVFLFDAARAMQGARQTGEALNLYQAYLAHAPGGAHREEVERSIRSLSRLAQRTHGQVRFRSEPKGATVTLIQGVDLRKGERRRLGITPFDVWLPHGRIVAEVSIEKAPPRVHLIEVEAGSVATVVTKRVVTRNNGFGRLRIIGMTAKSKITVGGQTVLATTGPKMLRVAAGRYRIKAQTPGQEPFDEVFPVAAGQSVTVDIGTSSLKGKGVVPVATLSRPQDNSGIRTGGWTLIGIGIAAVAAGVTLHVLAGQDGAGATDFDNGKLVGAYAADGVGVVSLITGGILLSF